MIPNLLIPGAAKSGTSSLHEYLNLHPKIEMSSTKEPHYFTFNQKYNEGLSFYDKLYNSNNAIYYGESSTAYLQDDLSLERIKQDLPEAKLILILREPVSRSVSHYLWQVGLKQEFRSFRKAVEYNMKHKIDWRSPGLGGNFKAYYEASLYGERLRKLISKFGKENIHVVTTKELNNDANATLKSCFDFLKIEPITIHQKIVTNKTIKSNDSWGHLKSFLFNSIRLGVVDFRLLYLATNKKIGRVLEEDKKWLHQSFQEDIELLSNYYPGIASRW